jgi:surfeit locus 1 family protein
VFLDNRQMNGKPGFYVLTPLQLDGGGSVVLVQRGWTPRNFVDRAALPKVETPAGRVTIQGRIAPAPSKLYDFAGAPPGPIRQNLDLATFRTDTRLPVLDVTVVQTGDASEGLVRQWPEPATGADKNYGYAFQWFGLAGLIVILYVWFQIVRRFFFPSRTARDEPLHADRAFPAGARRRCRAGRRRAAFWHGPLENARRGAGVRNAGGGFVFHLLRRSPRGPAQPW